MNTFYCDISVKNIRRLTNTIWYELISSCKANQVAIVNCRLGDDEGVGKFTFKNSPVVDYVVNSHVLFDYVINCRVHSYNELFHIVIMLST